MPCKMCRERGKTWSGDDPRCAFETGTFSSDNWNCATMNALRQRARELGVTYRDDNAGGSIGCVPLETEDRNGYIVMLWYKERGRTDTALILCWDEPPAPVTEADALAALAYSQHLVAGGQPMLEFLREMFSAPAKEAQDDTRILIEGQEKKGGVSDRPKSPRPAIPPPAQGTGRYGGR